MPRGTHPNSLANLKHLSSNEARKNGKKGGKSSAETRAATKSLTDTLKEALTDDKRKKIAEVLIKRAEAGNLKAIEMLLVILGEWKNRVEVSGGLDEQKDKLDALIDQLCGE